MKRYVFMVLVLIIGICLWGCKKKETALELPQPLTMEALSKAATDATITAGPQLQEIQPPAATQVPTMPPLEGLPSKPTTIEIQAALKNAGYYTASIDGKIGPLTTKAVEDFQKANGLKVDGKVGPKTWEILKNYLRVTEEPPMARSTRKGRKP